MYGPPPNVSKFTLLRRALHGIIMYYIVLSFVICSCLGYMDLMPCLSLRQTYQYNNRTDLSTRRHVHLLMFPCERLQNVLDTSWMGLIHRVLKPVPCSPIPGSLGLTGVRPLPPAFLGTSNWLEHNQKV